MLPMDIIRLPSQQHAPLKTQPLALAIGNFDGVHRGHRALLDHIKQVALEQNLTPAVLTFEPHPSYLFQPENPIPRIMTLKQKLYCLQRLGIECCIIQRFDAGFSQMSAHNFVMGLLHERLQTRHIAVGEGFIFGHGRKGNSEKLQHWAGELGITVCCHPPVMDGETPISSTRIRHALKVGNLQEANNLLGQMLTIDGRVIHGDKRGGNILETPTANLRLKSPRLLRYGVYAVKVTLANGAVLNGVANIGIRPTFEGEHPLAEIHLLQEPDHPDLYGETICVALAGFIRDEQRFDSIEALKTQIDKDIEQAKSLLAN